MMVEQVKVFLLRQKKKRAVIMTNEMNGLFKIMFLMDTLENIEFITTKVYTNFKYKIINQKHKN